MSAQSENSVRRIVGLSSPPRESCALLRRAPEDISDILCVVRNSAFFPLALLVAVVVGFLFWARPALPFTQGGDSQATPQQAPSAVAPAPAAPSGPVIVLDPAHGGTDTGARGENGVVEKDVVLNMARAVREQLAREGYRVLMTRNDDSDPSYDDRAAIPNGYRDAIFISLHVSSTGTPGTASAYYDQLASPFPLATAPATAGAKLAPPAPSGLAAWDEAQRPYADVSHHLADLIQSDLLQSFAGSPPASTAAPVRALRSVAAPAVAIEVSSVSGSTPDQLAAASGPLASAIAHGVTELRQGSFGGAK